MEPRKRPSVAARRFGYAIAVGINVAMIVVANNMLEWGWPSFLTDDFNNVLWILNLSLAAGIAANVVYFINDSPLNKAAGQIVTNLIGLLVSIRMLQVFPFDFSGWETDWSWALRTALIVGIVGTSVGAIVEATRLFRAAVATD